MLQRRVGEKFFNDIKSISLTPVAKRGLGKHFTFDFIAPCFEPVKYGDNSRQVPSFYGEVKFDYNQFGKNDKTLLRKAPLHYCLKQCHKLGYFLQKMYKIDLMRVKVDFYMDEFSKIWLMQTDKLFIR